MASPCDMCLCKPEIAREARLAAVVNPGVTSFRSVGQLRQGLRGGHPKANVLFLRFHGSLQLNMTSEIKIYLFLKKIIEIK